MKRIITAIGNSLINDTLKNNGYIVEAPDIQFKDDLIEVLKNKKDTEVLILNIEMIKKEEIKDYINKIKKINYFIKIIILSQNEDEDIKNIMMAIGIKDILYGNDISIQKLEVAINRNKTTEELLAEEINNLKEIVLNEKKKKHNLIDFNIIKQKNYKNIFKENKKNIFETQKENKIKNKVISIIGSSGVGKSIFCSNFSLAFENKKTLIIDFDILNKSIKTIFGVKEKVAEENEGWNKIDNLIIKISKNLDLICGIDVIFQNGDKQEKQKIISILDELKNKYDVILLDTSSECFIDYTKEIIKYSDLAIFLVEANLIELKKSKKLLEIYINNWKIEKEKINIIFNKYNKNSIDNCILKKLFLDFNILGQLKLDEKYNYMINKNTNYINKNLKEEYEKIKEKIENL